VIGSRQRLLKSHYLCVACHSPASSPDDSFRAWFGRHGADLGYADAQEYLDGANRVITSGSKLVGYDPVYGDTVYFIRDTNELVIQSPDGIIWTYYYAEQGIDQFYQIVGYPGLPP
jgi:hypothetical protein